MTAWRLWTESDNDQLLASANQASRFAIDQLTRLRLTTYDRKTGGKLPRNHNERSYRLTIGSNVLAATTLCYRRMKNCLEVTTAIVGGDDFGASDWIVQELLRFVLTDAYRCSGHCALTTGKFGRPHEYALVQSIERVANSLSVSLADWDRRVITVEEGRQLYLKLMELTPAAQAVLERLHQLGRMRSETLCYLLATETWSRSQAEAVLLTCSVPDAVFAGGASPADRHIHQYALGHTRLAILAGRLEDHLNHQWSDSDGVVSGKPNTTRSVQVQIEHGNGVRVFNTTSKVSLAQWSRSKLLELEPGNLRALVVAISGPEMERRWSELIAYEALNVGGGAKALVVPADFDQLLPNVRNRCSQICESAGIDILVAPDTFAQLSAEANRKLGFARIIRR